MFTAGYTCAEVEKRTKAPPGEELQRGSSSVKRAGSLTMLTVAESRSAAGRSFHLARLPPVSAVGTWACAGTRVIVSSATMSDAYRDMGPSRAACLRRKATGSPAFFLSAQVRGPKPAPRPRAYPSPTEGPHGGGNRGTRPPWEALAVDPVRLALLDERQHPLGGLGGR